MQESEVEELNV